LYILEGKVVLNTGEEFELKIPSKKIKIPVKFTIEEGMLTKVIIGFDASNSIKITETGEGNIKYILRPVIKPLEVIGPEEPEPPGS